MDDDTKEFHPTPEAMRFQQTLELHARGMEMMRLNLKRRHPDLNDEEIHKKLMAWLHDKPLPIDKAGYLRVRK